MRKKQKNRICLLKIPWEGSHFSFSVSPAPGLRLPQSGNNPPLSVLITGNGSSNGLPVIFLFLYPFRKVALLCVCHMTIT